MIARAFLLALPLTCLAAGASPIYREAFDTPTGGAYTYPIAQGYKSHLQDRVSGWAGNATISVAYAAGLGRSGGGIRCEVVKSGTDYAMLNLRLPLASLAKPGSLTVEQLRSLAVTFSVKGAEGLSLNPAVHPATKTEWGVRLALPEILLSSRWNETRLAFANAKQEALAAVTDAYNAGEKPELVLALYLKDLADWQEGDGFQLDNLVLDSEKR